MHDSLQTEMQELRVVNSKLTEINQELQVRYERKENELAGLLHIKSSLEQRVTELAQENRQLSRQHAENQEMAAKLDRANQDLALLIANKAHGAAELSASIKELAYQVQEKESRAAELESANHELESFTYSVSHDLRAPLRAINGFTEVLLEDYGQDMAEDARNLLTEVIANSRKMGELIDDLLEFSRLGKHQISQVRVNVNLLVNTAIKDLKHLEPDRNITFFVNDLEPVYGDRQMINQAFFNLISNAVKYSGKKTEAIIEIGNAIREGFITYYVKDNGAGFDMRYADKLFGIFQRLHSSAEFDGTGVGLAIVQKIVTKHGGTVGAEGKVGEGACFYISFPIHN